MTIFQPTATTSEPGGAMDNLVTILTITSAVSAGLMAGLYFAFSTSVMGGLRQQPGGQGISAMQSINEVIVNPLFLVLFVGSGLSCAALAVTAKLSDQPYPWWRIAAALLFVVGSLVVTGAINIPLNDKLAAVDPASAAGLDVWQDYVTRWTAWNHVRAASSTLAATVLAISLTGRG
jgi:uncharacterized membrane protein